MRFAIIDIGSNTIKMTVYDYRSTGMVPVHSTSKAASLISYIENGMLSDKGIRVLADTVSDLASEAGRNSCFYVFPFATASLRRASNYEAAIRKVKKQTGYTIDLISGEQEALFTFDGIVNAMGSSLAPDGIAFDMGGGSTEVILYESKKAKEFVSLDFGALSLFQSYVKRLLPTHRECAKIQKVTEKLYLKVPFIKGLSGISHLYMIGGTGRALARIHASLTDRPFTLPYTLSRAEIEALIERLICDGDHEAKLCAIREIPSRIHTVCTGINAVLSLMTVCGAEKLTVTDASVRDGYAAYIARLNGITND